MSKPTINIRYDEWDRMQAVEISGVMFDKADKFDLKDFAEALLYYLKEWL